MSASLDAAVATAVAKRFDELVDLRRTLHAAPELSFAEHDTTALIVEYMAALGLTQQRCPTPTGAVFSLDGVRPGPTVLLRADIDALPVTEASGEPFTSRHAGAMHACGHDAHAAVLLEVAGVLAEVGEVSGRLLFVFQPAEEAIGGAAAMLRGGLLDDEPVHAALGWHVTSLAPCGLVATRPGVAMAAAFEFVTRFEGPGGHGALDPSRGNAVLAAARFAGRLDEVTAGLGLEGTAGVSAPGVVRGGTALNVAPVDAEVAGTVRTFDDSQRAAAVDRLRGLAEEVAAYHGVSATIEIGGSTGPVHNDPRATAVVLKAARRLLPPATVVDMPSPTTASDDVAAFLDRVPGCYFFVGAAKADGTSGAHHSPTFAIDEAALATASRVMAAAALDLGKAFHAS